MARTGAPDTAVPSTPAPRPSRSPEQITADLESARQSLVANVGALEDYVRPANVLGRATDRVRRIYRSDDGEWNVKAVGVTAAVVGVWLLYRIRR